MSCYPPSSYSGASAEVQEEVPGATPFDQHKEPSEVEAVVTPTDTSNIVRTDEENEATSSSHNLWERQAVRIARYPKLHFWVAFIVSAILGILGITLQGLESADHTGWHSRGTVIANRHAQLLMIRRHAETLLYDGGDGDHRHWEELIENVQPGWEEDNSVTGGGKKNYRRLLMKHYDKGQYDDPDFLQLQRGAEEVWMPWLSRKLVDEQEDNPIALSSKLAQCDYEWYSDGRMLNGTRLWPVWKAKKSGSSFLDATLLEELCISESKTLQYLERNSLCTGCPFPNQCLPPFSLVLFARFTVSKGMDMTCIELAEAWNGYKDGVETDFRKCTADLKNSPKTLDQFVDEGLPETCPFGFNPSFLNDRKDEGGDSLVRYTSSIFPTTLEMVPELFDSNLEFDKGTKHIQGAYDTQYQDFVTILADNAVGTDMLLATASAIITTFAMLLHTRSLFLTLAGLLQICLSFPLAYFCYTFIIGMNFFPFLNFIGVFVVFALGADDVFVAVDKWKNFRKAHPDATTEQVAAAALPDAAYAMLLTTSTTSVAFFGTAVCPVAPIRVFAVFSGLLIFLDYIMVLVILFPCLCIYDGYRMKPSNRFGWCVSFEDSCGATVDDKASVTSDVRLSGEEPSEDTTSELQGAAKDTGLAGATCKGQETSKQSFIRRVLLGYYEVIHLLRWPLLVGCIAAFAVVAYFSTKMQPPENSEVRILHPSIEYEDNYAWRMKLLSTTLYKKEGSQTHVIWGVVPEDTGDQNDPRSWTQLMLDETFDPSTKDAQTYMLEFCDRIFNEEFAEDPLEKYVCPFNQFNVWLQRESNRTLPDYVWTQSCNGANGIPMDPEAFHLCLSRWAQITEEYSILAYKGRIQVIYFPFKSRVRFDSTRGELRKEWELINEWMKETNDGAPAEVSKAYFSSADFWYYDTTTQMYSTGYASIAIALAAAAIVILISSKSLVMTVLSVVSVAYVLLSVISMTVAIGWQLGFLESICFAIAVGISVDFVIHFSHAYTTPLGTVGREDRTKFALISMGPSILAAAFTTIAGATIMFFTTIQFFSMFATVLFLTIIQATLGSFVFFLTLTNCIGPSQPTFFADLICAYFGEAKAPQR